MRIVADVFASLGISFVVVGGQAVIRQVQVSTEDVDVMVATEDYQDTLSKIRNVPGVIERGSSDGLTQLRLRGPPAVSLDILDAGYFSGTKGGQELFRILMQEESSVSEGIRYASIGFVWYTRLSVPRWKAYVEKIIADTRADAGAPNIDLVRSLARKLGVSSVMSPRVTYLLDELRQAWHDDSPT